LFGTNTVGGGINQWSLRNCTFDGNYANQGVNFTGTISGNTLTVNSVQSGALAVGQGVTTNVALANFIGTIAGTALTVTSVQSGALAIGQRVVGNGVAANSFITAGSGTSWTLSQSSTVASAVAMTGIAGVPANTTITGGGGSTWTLSTSSTVAAPTVNVSGAVAGTGGVCRLTVSSTALFNSNNNVTVGGIGGATGCNTTANISAINTTSNYIELAGTTFGGTYTSGGTVAENIGMAATASACGSPDCVNGLAVYGWNYKIDGVTFRNILGNGMRREGKTFVSQTQVNLTTDFRNIDIDNVGRNGDWSGGTSDGYYANIMVVDASREADNTYAGVELYGSGGGDWSYYHGWHRSTVLNRAHYQFEQQIGVVTTHVLSNFEGGRQEFHAAQGSVVYCSTCSFYAPTSNNTALVDLDGTAVINGGRFLGTSGQPNYGVAIGPNISFNVNPIFITNNQFLTMELLGPVNFLHDGGTTFVNRGLSATAGGVTAFGGTPSTASSIDYDQTGPTAWTFHQRPNTTFVNNVTYSGSAPTAAGCGTGASLDSKASRGSGTLTFGTGTVTSCTLTFSPAFTAANHCRVSYQTSAGSTGFSYSLTAITLTGTALTGKADYNCDGN
jgi:hypothetical protein